MAAQALYRKWRSQDFGEVVAQEHVTRTLRNALRDGRVAHAYLFAGPRGTGKTSMARVLAKAVNCVGETAEKPCNQCHICRSITEGSCLDLIEIDAASNRGIDEVRDLRDKVNFRPNECRYRVYIMDEAHMLTTPAFNALLKTLEEPPAHAIFILVTTEPHNIPVTIISRCQRFDFRRIAVPDIVKHLKKVAAEEGFEITDEALEVIARQAAGGMRDALSLLDQLMAYRHEKITAERVQDVLGAAPLEAVSALARALVLRDLTAGLRVINDALDQGADTRQFNKELLEYLRGILLLKMGAEAASLNVTSETVKQMQQLAQKAQLAALMTAIKAFSQAALDLKESAHPRLPLEMALLEAVVADQVESQPKPAPIAEAAAAPKSQAVVQSESAKSAPVATKVEPRPAPESAPAVGKSASAALPEHKAASPTAQTVKPAVEPTATSAAKPPAASGKGAPTLDWVQKNWREVLLAVRAQDRSVEALLNKSCEPTQFQDNVLSLAFFHDFHKQKIEQDKNKKIVEAALSELTGAPVAVKCVAYEGDGRQRVEQKEKEEKTQRQTSAVEADPLVREAMDRYGGKIVDVQPLKE